MRGGDRWSGMSVRPGALKLRSSRWLPKHEQKLRFPLAPADHEGATSAVT